MSAFALSVGITLLGCAFGWFAIRTDPHSKAVLMPFSALLSSPAERVHEEESVTQDRLSGAKAGFSAQLMTHNIQVTIMTLAMGMTWGVGTLILLFYNGVILGAVAADYIAAGFGTFLTGWLLPHGSVEIPAILLGGQGGFILAGALIGWGGHTSRSERLRAVVPDLFAIVAGRCRHAGVGRHGGSVYLAISQAGDSVRSDKIAFGACELAALTAFLGWAGRE
ncbi:MAG: stage II sporulation protein M [Ignavibacteriota bacterium]